MGKFENCLFLIAKNHLFLGLTFAESDDFIRMANQLSSIDCTDIGTSRYSNEPVVPLLDRVISLLTRNCKAFDEGQISCLRLLDVIAFPFLKLAHQTCQLDKLAASLQAADVLVLFSLTRCLGSWLTAFLCVDDKTDSNGMVVRPIMMQPKQRSVFVKALAKRNFCEVKGYLLLPILELLR